MFGLLFIRTTPALLVFGVIIAALNFRNTDVFRRATGVSPWHIPPIYWALASVFVSLVITVLTLVAMRTTKVPGPGAAVRNRFDVPNWATGSATRISERTAPDEPGVLRAPARVELAPVAPPSWYNDPSGQHQYRFWDGARWTEHVATDGILSVDFPA